MRGLSTAERNFRLTWEDALQHGYDVQRICEDSPQYPARPRFLTPQQRLSNSLPPSENRTSNMRMFSARLCYLSICSFIYPSILICMSKPPTFPSPPQYMITLLPALDVGYRTGGCPSCQFLSSLYISDCFWEVSIYPSIYMYPSTIRVTTGCTDCPAMSVRLYLHLFICLSTPCAPPIPSYHALPVGNHFMRRKGMPWVTCRVLPERIRVKPPATRRLLKKQRGILGSHFGLMSEGLLCRCPPAKWPRTILAGCSPYAHPSE